MRLCDLRVCYSLLHPFSATLFHSLVRPAPLPRAPSCVNNLVVCVARGAIRMAEDEVVNFQLMKDMPLVHQKLRDTLVEVCVCARERERVVQSVGSGRVLVL